MKTKQEQVYDILVMSISCDKKYKEIVIKDGIILTSQKYCRDADEDMSDFSIGFYERLYQDLLVGNALLDKDGYLVNKEFAGDTMNSFNTLANAILCDSDKGHRAPEDKWTTILKNYYLLYHSLANFWLLPMRIGRMSAKLNKYDSVDLFLNRLSREFDIFKKEKYVDYFNDIKNFEDFCDKHYVRSGRNDSEVLEMYKERETCLKIVENAIDDIENRAKDISTSKYSVILWEYFASLRLYD